MNPVLHEGVRYAQHGWISGIALALAVGIFLAWLWWTFSSRNDARFEEAAQLPFGDEGILNGDKGMK